MAFSLTDHFLVGPVMLLRSFGRGGAGIHVRIKDKLYGTLKFPASPTVPVRLHFLNVELFRGFPEENAKDVNQKVVSKMYILRLVKVPISLSRGLAGLRQRLFKCLGTRKDFIRKFKAPLPPAYPQKIPEIVVFGIAVWQSLAQNRPSTTPENTASKSQSGEPYYCVLLLTPNAPREWIEGLV